MSYERPLTSNQMSSTAGELCAAGFEALWEAGFRTGDFLRADELLMAAQQRAIESRDVRTQASALDGLGVSTHYRLIAARNDQNTIVNSDIEAEEFLFREALRLHRQVGDAAGSALSLFGLGLVHQVLRRDSSKAMPYFRQALQIVEEHPDVDLYTQSEVHRHIGFYYGVEAFDQQMAV
jgi:hypothetical protein